MKRSKRLIGLVAILAVICVATFAMTKYEKKQEEIQNSDEIILEISSDSVETIRWDTGSVDLSFYRDDAGWRYTDDAEFPVSEEKMMELLAHFEAFGVSFIIENVDDYGQYGLNNPECTISITTAEDDYELKIGDFSTMDEQRYVDIGDGNVYLVSEDPLDYLATELSGMILHDETPNAENVAEIQFIGNENYTIFYEEESTNTYSSEDVYFTAKDAKTVPLDTDMVNAYIDTIESLSLSDYVTYNVSEDELISFGLEEPELTVTLDYTYIDDEAEVSDTYTLHLGQNQKELAAAQEAQENGENEIPTVTKYVRIGDSQIVYELDSVAYDTLIAASYDELRHTEVFWADSDLITQIAIDLEGAEHVLVSELDAVTEERIWYYGETEIDVTDLRAELKSIMADDFTSEFPTEKEEIQLTLYLDNETFPEVQIAFYRYDGKQCLAVVDGESVSLVERADVMELVEAVQAIILD